MRLNIDLTNYGQKKSINNIQDAGLLAKCGCIMCTTIVHRGTADIFVCLVLSKISKLYFHIQFKSHNIQNLNNKGLISTFF
jgi:hypothetical protein